MQHSVGVRGGRLYKHKGHNLIQRDLNSVLAFMPAKAIPALLLQINEGGAEKKALMPANINHLSLMFQSVGVS